MDFVELCQKDIDVRGAGGFKIIKEIDGFLGFSNAIQRKELKNVNKTSVSLEDACLMYLSSRIFFPF